MYQKVIYGIYDIISYLVHGTSSILPHTVVPTRKIPLIAEAEALLRPAREDDQK